MSFVLFLRYTDPLCRSARLHLSCHLALTRLYHIQSWLTRTLQAWHYTHMDPLSKFFPTKANTLHLDTVLSNEDMEITTTQPREFLFTERRHRTGPLAKAVADEHTFRVAIAAELRLAEARAVALPILLTRANKIPSAYLFIVKPEDPSLMPKLDESVEIQFPDITFSVPQRPMTENQDRYSYLADILRRQVQSAEATYTHVTQ